MAIPKFVTINGCKIPIKFVKHLLRDYSRYGEYSTTEMVINIDADLSIQRQEITLMHEILEAIKDIHDLDIDHELIQPIATGFYEVFKKNQIKFEV